MTSLVPSIVPKSLSPWLNRTTTDNDVEQSTLPYLRTQHHTWGQSAYLAESLCISTATFAVAGSGRTSGRGTTSREFVSPSNDTRTRRKPPWSWRRFRCCRGIGRCLWDQMAPRCTASANGSPRSLGFEHFYIHQSAARRRFGLKLRWFWNYKWERIGISFTKRQSCSNVTDSKLL